MGTADPPIPYRVRACGRTFRERRARGALPFVPIVRRFVLAPIAVPGRATWLSRTALLVLVPNSTAYQTGVPGGGRLHRTVLENVMQGLAAEGRTVIVVTHETGFARVSRVVVRAGGPSHDSRCSDQLA